MEGKTAIDALIVKEGEGDTLADLEGKTIGVKGKLPPSVKAMLAQAGLVEGTDYTTVGIEGFDPLVHIELPGLAGFPGYKSNEPGQLERAGVPFTLFDPSKEGIPGSFGILYTNAGFINDHPTAAQDFVRAAMRGMEDAIADPDAASQTAVDLINANGNENFLSPEGEQFRWRTESALVTEFTPDGQPVGLIDPAELQAQIDAYDAIGIFTAKPPIEGTYDEAPHRRRVRRGRQGGLATSGTGLTQTPKTRRADSMSCLSWAMRASMPSNLRSLRRKRLEAHAGRLAVEVAREVEQVGLEQRVVGVLVERRPPAQVDGARVDRPVRADVPAGVHAVGRMAHGVRHLDVGGGEAEQPAPHVAGDDRPPRLVEVAEQPRRHVDLAAGQGTADGGRADRLVDAVRALDQRHGLHLEVERGPELARAARRCPPGGDRSGSPRRSRRCGWRGRRRGSPARTRGRTPASAPRRT